VRLFQFKCDTCDLVEDIEASKIEASREEKSSKNDWIYCGYCGGIMWRVWNPPAIRFVGSGFTKGT
jgi:hypothetical protein